MDEKRREPPKVSSRFSCIVVFLLVSGVFWGMVFHTPIPPNPKIAGCRAFSDQVDGTSRVHFEVEIENAKGQGEVVVGVHLYPQKEPSAVASKDESLLVGPVGHFVSKGRSTVTLSSELFAHQPFEPIGDTIQAGESNLKTDLRWTVKPYILTAVGQTHH